MWRYGARVVEIHHSGLVKYTRALSVGDLPKPLRRLLTHGTGVHCKGLTNCQSIDRTNRFCELGLLIDLANFVIVQILHLFLGFHFMEAPLPEQKMHINLLRKLVPKDN